MPAYDYRCTACDERFEVTRSISDPAEVRCPTCAGATKRVFTPIGVHFKGSGFYTTDYKGQSSSAEKRADRPEPTPAAEGAAPPCAAAKEGGACATCPAAAES